MQYLLPSAATIAQNIFQLPNIERQNQPDKEEMESEYQPQDEQNNYRDYKH